MRKSKGILILLFLAIMGVVGITLAYFSNSTNIENEFITKEYGNVVTEKFVSPSNWLPGDTTEKKVVATNTGEVDQAVRISVSELWKTNNNGTLNGWIHTDGTKSTHTTESELANDVRVALIKYVNTGDWVYDNGYYYYKYNLKPGKNTGEFIDSVTFNALTKLDDTCETTIENGKKTITCNLSGSDYDHTTYTLTLNIETVQYNKYMSAWGTSVEIDPEGPQPVAQYLINKTSNPVNTAYNSETKGNLFALEHNGITDYRYIGNAPKNYVKFNCDDNGSNCETWRILGVFNVERKDPDDDTKTITESRLKIVRGYAIPPSKLWNDNGTSAWTSSTLKNFLNGEYYNRTGNASTYGLKQSARDMIGEAKYYLGGNNSLNATPENLYTWERENNGYGSYATEWFGNVGMMYPSDQYFTYANGVDSTCYNNASECNNYLIASKSWIYNSNKKENSGVNSTWFLTPYTSNGNSAYGMYLDGRLSGQEVQWTNNLVRPVVYLKSNIKIISGTGESGNPYVLGIFSE